MRSYVVSTPLLAGGSNNGSLVITKLAPAGSAVKTGDVLVEFDRQAQDKLALDKKAEYDDLVQQIAQKKAEQDAARVKDESEVAQAENALKAAELEVLKNEMLSRIKAETNDQNLAEARRQARRAQGRLPAEAGGGRRRASNPGNSSATAPRPRWITRRRTQRP